MGNGEWGRRNKSTNKSLDCWTCCLEFKYLCRRDSEFESCLYPGTSLFLLKSPGSQGPQARHAGGWGTAGNEAGHQRVGTHSVSDTRILLQTPADEWGRQVGEEKGSRGLAVSRGWWGSAGGCCCGMPGPEPVTWAPVWVAWVQFKEVGGFV